MDTIHLLALGNPLMRDDAAGAETLKLFRKKQWPCPVEIHQTGTDSLSYTFLLTAPGKIIVTDALRFGQKPGTVCRIRADRLMLQRHNSFSLHDMHFLHMAASFFPQRLNHILVYGIEPANLSPGMALSPQVRAVLPLVARLITREILRHGNS